MADFTDCNITTPGPNPDAVLVAWSDQGAANFVGEYVFFAFAEADSVPPALANFSPTADSVLAKYDTISFDVTDVVASGEKLFTVQVGVYIISTDTTELAWAGDLFENQYVTSTRTDITDGYRFVLRRRMGWPSGGVRVKVRVVDRGGNVGTL